jgi:hypothetical protein
MNWWGEGLPEEIDEEDREFLEALREYEASQAS